MDKNIRDFLISKLTTSFSDIGYVLSILLSEIDGTAEKDRSFKEPNVLEDRTRILDGIVHDAAESVKRLSDSSEKAVDSTAQKKTRKTSGTKTAKPAEKEVTEKKAEDTAVDEKTDPGTITEKTEVSTVTEKAEKHREEAPVEQPQSEADKAEGPAQEEEEKPQSINKEVKEDEETIRKKLKDDMTALALREKGFAIQKGLADYKVSRISEVNINDIDDFRTRVYYYAGELEVQDA